MLRKWIAAVTTAGVLMTSLPLAATANEPTRLPVTTDAPRVVHACLLDGGMLAGHVVDAQGLPVAETRVVVSRGERALAHAQTDADGCFVVKDLQPGPCQIAAANAKTSCQLWTAQTAPPVARPHIVLTSNPYVVRGQGPLGLFDNPGDAVGAGLIIGGTVWAITELASGS